jgi:hypothetical protein
VSVVKDSTGSTDWCRSTATPLEEDGLEEEADTEEDPPPELVDLDEELAEGLSKEDVISRKALRRRKKDLCRPSSPGRTYICTSQQNNAIVDPYWS